MLNRLLVCGIPGTGNTYLGEHLRATRAFIHIDMEDDGTRARFRSDRTTFLQQLSEPAVITWGFHPCHDVPDILYLKQAGFRLVWLDGNRPAALREFIRRGTVQEPLFYLQLWNIESTKVVQAIAPDAIVNPFDGACQFRAVNELAEEVLRVA